MGSVCYRSDQDYLGTPLNYATRLPAARMKKLVRRTTFYRLVGHSRSREL